MDESRHSHNAKPGGRLWLLKWVLIAVLVVVILLLVLGGSDSASAKLPCPTLASTAGAAQRVGSAA